MQSEKITFHPEEGQFWWIVKLIVSFIAILGLAGCAIIDPHVRAPEFTSLKYATTSNLSALAKTLDAADAQRRAYLGAAEQYSVLRNSGTLAGAGLGASAAFLAAFRGGNDLIRGTAAGALGAIGLATLYDNRTRQLVYLGGAEAIGCAISAQAPLLAPSEGLAMRTARLRTALGALLAVWHPGFDLGAHWKADQVEALVASAQTALDQVDNLDAARAGALREAVYNIMIAVEREIVRTDPDPRNVWQAVSQLKATGSEVLPGAFTPPPPTAGLKAADDGILAADLAAALIFLGADTGAGIAGSGLGDCKLPATPNMILVMPDEAAHVVSQLPYSITYLVAGGIGNRSGALTGSFPTDTIKLAQTALPDGSLQLRVDFDAGAAGAVATLWVSDTSGYPPHQTQFQVAAKPTLVNASYSGTGGGMPKPKPVIKPAAFVITPQRLALVRATVPTSGSDKTTLEPSEIAPLKAWLATHGQPSWSGSNLDQTSWAAIVSAAQPQPGKIAPPQPFEQAIIPTNQASQLRCWLNIGAAKDTVPSDMFDDKFRISVFLTKANITTLPQTVPIDSLVADNDAFDAIRDAVPRRILNRCKGLK